MNQKTSDFLEQTRFAVKRIKGNDADENNKAGNINPTKFWFRKSLFIDHYFCIRLYYSNAIHGNRKIQLLSINTELVKIDR